MKISKEDLLSFRTNITHILSYERLGGYEGNVIKHFDNLELSKEIVKKLAILEIYLRNMLDFCLSTMIGKDWIKSERSLRLIKAKGKTPLKELNSHQILSSLMFGELVELIEEYKVKVYMLNLEGLDFKKYHWSNRNFFYVKGKKSKLSNVAKVTIVLNLIRNIRNRAFHWENLLKVTFKNDGSVFPSITHKEGGSTFGIMPDKILEFLDDLIDSIGNEEIKKYRN